MPPDERTVLLEGPGGSDWEAIYKPVRGALSGGWRAFAIDHALEDGDAAMFEVIDKVGGARAGVGAQEYAPDFCAILFGFKNAEFSSLPTDHLNRHAQPPY